MTEKIETGDLKKALQTLTDLAKGHNSRGTATTEVVGMTGESGATQVFHTASNSDPSGWAGSSWAGVDWSDSIGPDGTDYKSAGAAMRKSVLAKIENGQALTKGERNFVAKGGIEIFSKGFDPKMFAKKGDDEDEDDKKDKKSDVKKSADHCDEEEDKKLIKEELAKDKKSEVKKSFMDHSADNAAVSSGFEVSEFLAGFAEVMHKSLSSMEQRMTDRVLTSISRSSADQGDVSKSMAEALANLGEVLVAQAQRIEQVESGASRAPKSTTIAKSQETPDNTLSKSQVSGILLQLVQKSEATAQDVLKFDATGEMSNELRAKIARR